MKLINKTDDSLSPYTYLIKFNYNGDIKMYYGVRYGNVRIHKKPSEDLFKIYYTSSKDVNILLSEGIYPYEIIIHKTFKSISEACQYEINFLTRIDAMRSKNFLNHTNSFRNDLAYSNVSRIMSEETKKKISIGSSKWQSDINYRKWRSETTLERWSDPKFKEYMNECNKKFFESEKGKSFIKDHLNKIWIGRKHSDKARLKMSESAKRVASNSDMKARVLKRKRYYCPICNMPNLDGRNFNNHTKAKHGWNKLKAQEFKKNYIL